MSAYIAFWAITVAAAIAVGHYIHRILTEGHHS